MKNLKFNSTRTVALGTLGVMALGSTLLISAPAQAASSKTWKKAAIVGGAVTGYGLLKHNGRATTLGAVATAGSYYMYKKKKKQESRRHHHRRR